MTQATTPDPRPVPIKAYGLVIDNDNSFSLGEVEKFGYRVNSVRHSPILFIPTSNLSLGNTSVHGSRCFEMECGYQF